IAAHKDKLAALKDHKKGLQQNLFPDPAASSGGETVPKVRFLEFEGDGAWVEKKLGYFFKSLDAGVSVNSGDRPATRNEIGILKTSCLKEGLFDSSENKVVFSEIEI